MVRSSGFGSVISDNYSSFQARFHYGFNLCNFNLPLLTTRRNILQQARRQTLSRSSSDCKLAISRSFHSHPWVLFTIPSRYYSLSDIQEYLALRGGPRRFIQSFTFSILLGKNKKRSIFGYKSITFFGIVFQLFHLIELNLFYFFSKKIMNNFFPTTH